jgi:hypothetical protein
MLAYHQTKKRKRQRTFRRTTQCVEAIDAVVVAEVGENIIATTTTTSSTV